MGWMVDFPVSENASGVRFASEFTIWIESFRKPASLYAA